MRVEEARAVLGVAPGADATEIRRTFRQLVRRHHPDIAGSAGGGTTARIVTAYRTLLAATGQDVSPPAAAPAPSRPAAPIPPVRVEGPTVMVRLPPDETWRTLLEVGHGLGELAYVDGRAGLLELIVEFLDHPVCSVVITLQGRATGWTEADCSVEALSGDPAPPADAVARLVADRLRAQLAL